VGRAAWLLPPAASKATGPLSAALPISPFRYPPAGGAPTATGHQAQSAGRSRLYGSQGLAPRLRVACPTMNAEQVNAVGGWCELVGVAFLVRDLMSLARYREKPKEWAVRLKKVAAQVRAWWVTTPMMGWWRRLRGRPHQVVFAEAGIASASMVAGDATVSTGTASLGTGSSQSLEAQVQELRRRVNELAQEIAGEKQQREQALAAEREARHREIQAEAEERERGDVAVRQDVDKLRDVTTGDLGLRFESVVYLVLGIVLTSWSDLVAARLGDWLRFRVAMVLVLGWPALRFWWLWKSRESDVAV
jgi:hypothetical protein